LVNGKTAASAYRDFPDHFGFFLPLAGITTVEQISENAFDIRATSRLNRLYVELLKDNPDWGTDDRRPDMNHFMARLIFCFFAEDTDIFHPSHPFTGTVEKMSARDSSNRGIGESISQLDQTMLPDTLRASECELAVSLKGNAFKATGEYERDGTNARGLALMGSKITYQYKIEYEGVIHGRAILGTVKRVQLGDKKPSSLLALGLADTPSDVYMIIDDDGHTIRAMENPSAAVPTFYSLTK
jgi:hypothetical protein